MINHETIVDAFSFGYHSERLPGATHTVHNLRTDAQSIVDAAGIPHAQQEVYEALIHGIEPQVYDDTESTLSHLAQANDSIMIWTEGDPVAQVHKVRALGWEAAIRLPQDPGNFIVYASEDKHSILPAMTQYVTNHRHVQHMFVLDNSRDNLEKAQKILSADYPNQRISYVWMNRTGKEQADLPPFISEVRSLTEYEEMVQAARDVSPHIGHFLDLDATLIDPKRSEQSRKQAVISTLTDGKSYARMPRPNFHKLNGFYAVDPESYLSRITSTELTKPDFAGHQASIYQAGEYLVKVFAHHAGERPGTPDWQNLGGFRGAESLIAQLRQYRARLSQSGFRVPEQGEFLLGKDTAGMCFAIEFVPNIGNSLQQTFIEGTPEERFTATRQILEASYPVITADNIGADIKPANFVRNGTGELVHIDPLPIIMVDETTGEVTTEWPRIEAPEIQDFLYKTHVTPMAVGYRFYQELCQIDPKNRSRYQHIIRSTLEEWRNQGKMSIEDARSINAAMEPETSVLLKQILHGEVHPDTAFAEISGELDAYTDRKEHPIYALREMAFLVSEYILTQGRDMKEVCSQALDVVEDQIGTGKREKIEAALAGIPEELHYLTVIRKLTHLSKTDWQAGAEEAAAFDIIEQTGRMLA